MADQAPGFVDRTRKGFASQIWRRATLLRIIAGTFLVLGLVCIAVFFFKGSGAGKLVWENPQVRKSLMTFAYKVYANPAAENGRYFLSKIVFRNDGTSSVRNFSITYQIPDYVPWTTPETHSEIP